MSSSHDLRARRPRLAATLLVLGNVIASHPVHAQRPSAPTGLAVSGTSASATLTWESVEGAVSYSVKRWKQDDPKCCNNSAAELSRPGWTDTGASNEGFPQPGVYVFEVTAQLRETSSAATIDWTLAAPAPSVALSQNSKLRPAPATRLRAITSLDGPPPQNVQVLPGGPVVHRLVWDSAPGASAYNVFRYNATTGEWMPANGTPFPAPTFVDTNLVQPGARYRVVAMYSDGRQGSTDFLFSNPPPLQVPTGFTAAKVAPGKVRLSWQPVSFAAGYRILGDNQPADGQLVHATQLFLSGLADGAHSWKLTADYGGAYETANLPSASITLYTPNPCAPPQWKVGGPAPASLFFFSGIVGGAQIQWTKVPGAVAYVIDRQLQPVTQLPARVGSSCGTPESFETNLASSLVKFRDLSGGVTPGASYGYFVSAIGPAGEIGFLGKYWTAPKPLPIQDLSAKTVNSGSTTGAVSVTWRWTHTGIQIPPTDFVVTAPYGLNLVVNKSGHTGGTEVISGKCVPGLTYCSLAINNWPSGTHLITVTSRWRASDDNNALVLATRTDTTTLVKP